MRKELIDRAGHTFMDVVVRKSELISKLQIEAVGDAAALAAQMKAKQLEIAGDPSIRNMQYLLACVEAEMTTEEYAHWHADKIKMEAEASASLATMLQGRVAALVQSMLNQALAKLPK